MKIIPEFPAYYITESGEVISTKYGNISKLKPVLCKSTGYLLVTLVKEGNIRKNKRIHRLMMEAFVPNPENKAHVNHKNSIKTDNRLENLEWATCAENSQHAMDNGLSENVLNATRVAVRQLTIDGTPIAEFASLHDAERATGAASQNIYKVCRGKRKSCGGFRWEYKNV